MQPEVISCHPTSCFLGEELNTHLTTFFQVFVPSKKREMYLGFHTINGSGKVMGCWCQHLPEKCSGFLFPTMEPGQELEQAAQGSVAIIIPVRVQKACGCATWGYGLVVDTVLD